VRPQDSDEWRKDEGKIDLVLALDAEMEAAEADQAEWSKLQHAVLANQRRQYLRQRRLVQFYGQAMGAHMLRHGAKAAALPIVDPRMLR
jgi:hypothetical protein